jgi:putative redox protein
MTDNIRPRPLFAKDIVGSFSVNRQQVVLEWRAGTFLIDEPRFNGGQDLGPDPFTLVSSGLVGCTLTTLRMYTGRKEWDIHDITASVNIMQQPEPFLTTIHRKIVIRDTATDEQRDKLLDIAKRCPVARHPNRRASTLHTRAPRCVRLHHRRPRNTIRPSAGLE